MRNERRGVAYETSNVMQSFGSSIWPTGNYISRAGGVESLATIDGDCAISFLVRDPRDGRIFSGILNAAGDRQARRLSSTCSCGDDDCAHGCAAALAALADNAPWSEKALAYLASAKDQALNRWLERALPQRPEGAGQPQELPRFLVALRAGRPEVVRVTPAFGPNAKDRAHPAQRPFGATLTLLELSGLTGVEKFDAHLAAIALNDAVRSGRAHLDSAESPPLAFVPIERDEIRWEPTANDTQHPRLASRPAAVLLPTSPVWYVDPAHHQAGPVDLGIDASVVAPLATIPLLSKPQAERAHKLWHRYFPPGSVPPPRTDLRITIEPEPLVPHLRVGVLDAPSRHARPVTGAVLSFRYGAATIAPSDEASEIERGTAEGVAIVPRDRDAEAAAIATLQALGLRNVRNVLFEGEENAFVFPSPSEDAADWLAFLRRHAPALRASGWEIEFAESFPHRVREIDDWSFSLQQADNRWFDLDLGIELDGRRVSLLPIVMQAMRDVDVRTSSDLERYLELTDGLVVRVDGALVALPKARVAQLFSTIVELFDESHAPGAPLRLPAAALAALHLQDETAFPWAGAAAVRPLLAFLNDRRSAPPLRLPPAFVGTLRPYQRTGVQWLQLLRESGFGAILADDMGLGKTVQIAAHVAIEKAAGRLTSPALVIAKASGVPHWIGELARFVPSLSVHEFLGTDRAENLDEAVRSDIVLTTHASFTRSLEELRDLHWSMAIVDEAQAMKNAASQLARGVQSLSTGQPIALTGTPVENSLTDLYSLISFTTPGLLGDRKRFGRIFRAPIEKHEDEERRDALSHRVRPFVLRRTKKEVAKELPPKTEIVTEITLSGAQRDLYETIRLSMLEQVRTELRKKGLARSHITVLTALLKLRQVCCDPRLVKLPSARNVGQSQKLETLMEMLPELILEGRRILLFSQFTEMLDLMIPELERQGIPFVELRGSTRDRRTPKARFDAGEVPLFLLSLKAGGTSLNLQSADCVLMYDPWWNPAVETQAIDRAYRIGQTQPVFVYKFITTGTVEERIVAMQERKGRLADRLFTAGGSLNGLNESDIEALFAPL